jgi:uroporphyrinogen decarboxylase
MRVKVEQARKQRRRLVVPLMGFPGLSLTRCTVKLAQQNYGEHFKVIKALADRFHPDAMFPLMDLAVEANALGRYTVFPKEDSATVVKDTFDMNELKGQKNINMAYDTRVIGYVEVEKLMNIGLDQDIMRGAYVTGPYSLAALMMGADEAAMATVLKPKELELLCQFTTDKIQHYVRQLIAAGAEIICILEPSAVMLGPDQFERFSSQFVKHLNDSCKYTGVATVYHTCGNTMHLIDKMVEADVDAISLDSPDIGVDLPETARRVPDDVMVMGNINPTGTMLKGAPHEVQQEVYALLETMKHYPNYILSTGCDLPQETPLENIRAFMEAGRNYRL